MKIKELSQKHLTKVRRFTDAWIGKNYYSLSDLKMALDKSIKHGLNASLIATLNDEIIGVSIRFAPGSWDVNKSFGFSYRDWGCNPKNVAYSKSKFVAEEYRGRGVGSKLWEETAVKLREMGTSAVLAHSWLESPGNSSQRHLKKLGFEEVNRHEKFWHSVDYQCTRCAPERCTCTAVEMIKYLRN